MYIIIYMGIYNATAVLFLICNVKYILKLTEKSSILILT